MDAFHSDDTYENNQNLEQFDCYSEALDGFRVSEPSSRQVLRAHISNNLGRSDERELAQVIACTQNLVVHEDYDDIQGYFEDLEDILGVRFGGYEDFMERYTELEEVTRHQEEEVIELSGYYMRDDDEMQ